MRHLPLLFLFSSLYATFTEPLTFEVHTGYREDHFNWRLQLKDDSNLNVYHEKYDHLRYWQNNLAIRSINRDIYIYAEGGYGAFGRGDADQDSIRNSAVTTEPRYTFQTHAEAFHAKGTFGYFVNLTPLRYYRVAIIPTVGYSMYYTKFNRKNPSPDPFTGPSPTAGISTQVFSSLERDLKLRWYGPFIGGIIYACPGANFVFEAGYHYHWLQIRQAIFNEFRRTELNSSSEIVTDTNQIQKGKLRTGSNLGHEGLLKTTYLLSSHVRLSGLGKLFYFSSRVKAILLDQQTQSLVPLTDPVDAVVERNYKGRYVFWFALFELDLLL